MASTEDLGRRLERLEQRFSELDGVVKRSNSEPSARVQAWISPSGWLAVTGPVFAALALGFGLLWNAQQANTSRMLDLDAATNARMLELHKTTTAHLIELTRTTARLEGAIDHLDSSVQELRNEVKRLSERMDRLES